ncbi:MAG: hypothetical protein ACRD00_08110 [Thermoanaerobaculia bacterium]
MMAKTQVSLEPELQRQARQRAAQLGVSFAKYVRTLVARDLGRRRRRSDPSVVFNLGASGESDVGRLKDAMLGEAIAAERARHGGRH